MDEKDLFYLLLVQLILRSGISGKYYNKPIHQLLGGKFREKIKPYATGFYRIKGQNEASRLEAEALNAF